MSLIEKPFWWDTLVFPLLLEEKPLPPKVDVTIIGGGYTGLSAARRLAMEGASVAVLERETIGWGASSRNGGMVLTGLKLSAAAAIRKYGREIARRLYAASLASIDCVEQIVNAERIECDFARCGHLEVAYKPAHFDGFQKDAALIEREFGHTLRIVPKSELRAEIGSDLYHGGLVDETSGGLNPAKYVAGLARAAAKRGAGLHEHTSVRKIEREADGWKVITSRGEVRAKEVLAATNGYTGPATPAFHRRIVPVGSYLIATEPLPLDLARQVSPRNRMMFDTKNFLYYFRLSPDRRMIFGGRAGFYPESPNTVRESAAILERAMTTVYPQLRGVRVAYAWGGTLGFTFDLMPHAGRLDGIWHAMGYAGHGVALATYLGQAVADRILGVADDNPFHDLEFPTAPLGLYDGRPWFLPLAEAWYRFLDWVS